MSEKQKLLLMHISIVWDLDPEAGHWKSNGRKINQKSPCLKSMSCSRKNVEQKRKPLGSDSFVALRSAYKYEMD